MRVRGLATCAAEGNRSSALGCPPPDRDTSSVLHPNVGFVHPPGAVAHSQMPADSLFKLRCVGLDPSEDRRVVDLDSAVEEHEFQIAVADREHQIPSHRPKDRLGCELAPLEPITQTHPDARPIVPHSIITELRQRRSLQQEPLTMRSTRAQNLDWRDPRRTGFSRPFRHRRHRLRSQKRGPSYRVRLGPIMPIAFPLYAR